MSNWVHNTMKITGKEIVRFKQTCMRGGELDFDAINPMPLRAILNDGIKAPTGCDNLWDWAWSTKSAVQFAVNRDEPDCFECCFDTANGAPVLVWNKLAELFPTLTFELSGNEPLNDWAFHGWIQNGEVLVQNVPLIWETVDPKTGERVRGTREEVEATLKLT
jgi:hypothetical protein